MTMEQFKDVFLIIGPLIGVVVGGLITTVAKVIELHYTKKRDLAKIRLEKLEAIYQCTNSMASKSSRLCHYLGEPGRDLTSVETQVRFNQYLDEVSDLNAKTHAIHNLYLGEAGTEWALFGASISVYTQTAADFQRKTVTYVELEAKLEAALKSLTAYHVALIDTGRSLTKVATKEAKQYRKALRQQGE